MRAQADDDTMAFVQTVHVEHARDSSTSYKKYDLFEATDVDHSKLPAKHMLTYKSLSGKTTCVMYAVTADEMQTSTLEMSPCRSSCCASSPPPPFQKSTRPCSC